MIFFEILYEKIENIPGIVVRGEDEFTFHGNLFYETFGWLKESDQYGEYKGRKVKLNKPFRTPKGPKKFSVYVKREDGKVIKVNFGDPNMRIRRYDPERRKSFAARHRCHTANDPTTPRYWSCRAPLSAGKGYW